MVEWIVSSCFVILAMVALRAALGTRISAGLRYGLWGLVLIRLLVPVQFFVSPVAGMYVNYASLEVLQEENFYILPMQSIPIEEAQNALQKESNALLGDDTFGQIRLEDGGENVQRYALRVSLLQILKWIWLAGAAVLATILLIANFRFFLRLRRVRKPLDSAAGPIRVYTAEGLPSPCLFGLFQPAVYVTPETVQNPIMLRHVMAHELGHYRHLDHLWSILRGVALAIHWWNPLVWLAVVLSRRDGELACDQSALRYLGEGERRAYGETLLTLVTTKSRPQDLVHFATTMRGGKKSLQERICQISCNRKYLVSASIAASFLLILVTLTAFGRKVEDGDTRRGNAPEHSFQGRECTLDLDRDGETEHTLVLQNNVDPPEWELCIFKGYPNNKENIQKIWSVTLDESHGGCGTYFLYSWEGLDYLLEYMPKMQQGYCTYSYRLFHLENGEEVTDLENSVEFDINFDSPSHQFNATAIASFMEEINTLIGKSVLLINTNHWMLNLDTTEDGRLYDDILASLHHPGEDLHSIPLQEALEIYVQQSEDHPDDTNSALGNLLADMEADDLGSAVSHSTITAEQLTKLLRKSLQTQESRYYNYSSFREEEAWRWTASELSLPLADSGILHLIACESGSVEIVYETEESSQSAFFTSEKLYQLICEVGETYPVERMPYAPDLNHDGTPDELFLREDPDSTAWVLQCAVSDNSGKPRFRWNDTAYTAHAGWNAIFLCQIDGTDYLLRYTPEMSSGVCHYKYQLFYLEDGGEVTVQENEVDFDIIFARDFAAQHHFDPRAIAAFMTEINDLLENSTQLLNTDASLLMTFQEEGRLYDSLWWLLDDNSIKDSNRPFLENLLVYRNNSLANAAIPSVREILGEIRADDIITVSSGTSVVSYKDLAAALNDIAEWSYDRHTEDWEAVAPAIEITYKRSGDWGEQSIILEMGQSGGQGSVRITFSGQATALQYSENPADDATYLHDVPYSFSVYVANETLVKITKDLHIN